MGDAGRAHARAAFDWSVIVHQYQALWHEQAQRRRAEKESAARSPGAPANPLRQDPMTLFADYPSAAFSREMTVELRPGADRQRLAALRASGLARIGIQLFSPEDDIALALAHLNKGGACSIETLLHQVPLARREVLYRTIGWMLKTDLIAIAAPRPRVRAP
jgi:hypothetical protein